MSIGDGMVGQRKKPAGSWGSPCAALDLAYAHVWQPNCELLESALLSLDRGPSTSAEEPVCWELQGSCTGRCVCLERTINGPRKTGNWTENHELELWSLLHHRLKFSFPSFFPSLLYGLRGVWSSLKMTVLVVCWGLQGLKGLCAFPTGPEPQAMLCAYIASAADVCCLSIQAHPYAIQWGPIRP